MILLKSPVKGKIDYLDKGGIISQFFAENFQWYWDNAKTNGHDGLDIATFEGDNIMASLAGKVVNARWSQHGGNTITIITPITENRYLATLYCHNRELLVKEGQNVVAGQIIAKMGKTGDWCFGVHLHFAVFLLSDPEPNTQQLSYPTGDSFTRLNFNNGWKGALNPLFYLENSPMKYVIVGGKEQYLLYEPLKLAFNIGDEKELEALRNQGLQGDPVPVAQIPAGYLDIAFNQKGRLKEEIGKLIDLLGIDFSK